MGTARSIWRSRWGLLRLAAAAFLLWAALAGEPAKLARAQLAALPGFDYASEVARLRTAGRLGEAVMVADEGGAALREAGDEAGAARVAAERELAEGERSGVLHRAKEVGLGALSGQAGSGRGGSVERVVGAIGADLFVVGDVRDLLIQGAKYLVDGESDELIVLLSAVGLATTLAPEIDWAPAILKIARKAGAVTAGLAESVKGLVKGRRIAELRAVLGDVASLARRATPGGAVRALRYADGPADLARLSRFVEAERAGAFALHVTGREGAGVLKVAGEEGAGAVVKAARKGAAGTAWLRTGAWRRLARPHPIVGVLKAFEKGNAAELARRVIERLDPHAWWIVPALAAWLVVEVGALLGRAFRGRPA